MRKPRLRYGVVLAGGLVLLTAAIAPTPLRQRRGPREEQNSSAPSPRDRRAAEDSDFVVDTVHNIFWRRSTKKGRKLNHLQAKRIAAGLSRIRRLDSLVAILEQDPKFVAEEAVARQIPHKLRLRRAAASEQVQTTTLSSTARIIHSGHEPAGSPPRTRLGTSAYAPGYESLSEQLEEANSGSFHFGGPHVREGELEPSFPRPALLFRNRLQHKVDNCSDLQSAMASQTATYLSDRDELINDASKSLVQDILDMEDPGGNDALTEEIEDLMDPLDLANDVATGVELWEEYAALSVEATEYVANGCMIAFPLPDLVNEFDQGTGGDLYYDDAVGSWCNDEVFAIDESWDDGVTWTQIGTDVFEDCGGDIIRLIS